MTRIKYRTLAHGSSFVTWDNGNHEKKERLSILISLKTKYPIIQRTTEKFNFFFFQSNEIHLNNL